MKNESVNLVVADDRFQDGPVSKLLQFVKANKPKLPVLIVSENKSVSLVIECMKLGAVDFLIKPLQISTLKAVVRELFDAWTRSQRAKKTTTILPHSPLRVIGGYEILRTLSEGNMGKVLLAEKLENGKKCQYALKIVKYHGLPDDEIADYLERFIKEIDYELAGNSN